MTTRIIWRIALGGTLVLFTLGVYLGHQLWGADPQPNVVTLDMDYSPDAGTTTTTQAG